MNLFEGKEGRCRYKEWACGTIGGESGTDGENSFGIYTLLWVKEIAPENLLNSTGAQLHPTLMGFTDTR